MTTSSMANVLENGLGPPAFAAGRDLIDGLARFELWSRLGWLDVKRRYRRTVLGPFWTSLSLGIYAVALGLVGSGLWHQDIGEYLPFLVSGLVVWYLISTIISESCNLFIAGGGLFRNVRFEYSILVYQLLWRNLIVFLHNVVVYLLVAVILKPGLLGPMELAAIPGLIMILAIGGWITLLCGMFCLRFRDVQSLVATVVQISMLVTPIFWPPETLAGLHRLVFVEMNPFYHMIQVVRAPLLGELPGLSSYIVVFLIMSAGWVVTYFVYQSFQKRIAYWS
jgi:ABC-type polysaccharide/polyol phosphate export permease